MSRSRWLLVAPALALLPMACGDDEPGTAGTDSSGGGSATTVSAPSGGPIYTPPEPSDDLPPDTFNGLYSV
ncbi:MAG: hypothetical protein M3527_06045, partial [Actinomycetota bacterium]|nr:hypothetical protein [Actinomycetota bacterium]